MLPDWKIPENLAEFASSVATDGDILFAGRTAPQMKTVRDLPLWPVWVNPEHKVKTAIVLMRGHALSGLGVIQGDRFIGTLNLEDLVGATEDESVERYVRLDQPTVAPSATLRAAAQLLAANGLGRVAVVEAGEFLGIVSAIDLLSDISQNFDPLTGLQWSDGVRDWCVSSLESGREITILFFDIDDFGRYNKSYGHLIGDSVLIRIADILSGAVDSNTDALCRYGGDEFVVATTRPRPDAEMFARFLRSKVGGISLEADKVAMSITYGIFGGRRTKERDGVHLSATVDNLINMASKACMAAKPDRQDSFRDTPIQRGVAALSVDDEGRRPSVLSSEVKPSGNGRMAIVVLRLGEKNGTGLYIGAEADEVCAARATADAFRQINDGRTSIINDVSLTEPLPGRRVVTVRADVAGVPVSGSATIENDSVEAAVRAALEALS